MFKFICVHIQVEAHHNKTVTQKMGSNRKYVKRDKKEASKSMFTCDKSLKKFTDLAGVV